MATCIPVAAVDVRERRQEALELHGLSSREILLRGLPEVTPQAEEGMQRTRSRVKGRETVQPGAPETGRRLLPDLHAARCEVQSNKESQLESASDKLTFRMTATCH